MINFIAEKKSLIIGVIALNMSGFACMQYSNTHAHQNVNCYSPRKNVFLAMMDTMMRNMDTVKTGISPEHDFMSLMIPHHRGAITMAQYEMENGKNFVLVQLAKSILVEQQSEIMQMQYYENALVPVDYEFKGEFKKEMNETMNIMMHHMIVDHELDDVDRAFAIVMIPHHQAGIDMARVILKFSADNMAIGLSKQIIASQETEIEQMSSYLNRQHE